MYEDVTFQEIRVIAQELQALNIQLQQLVLIEAEKRDIMNEFLDLSRQAFAIWSAPAGFGITEKAVENTMPKKKEKSMSPTKVKASADFVILDDGKGVLYTLQPINAAGNAVPNPAGTITAVSSAPASLTNAVQDLGDPTANPPRPADTTGLVFLSTVPQPPVDAVGIVMTFTDTLTSGSVISTAANPVDVTADNTPAGFTITESVAS
jgi:hypothetical protein